MFKSKMYIPLILTSLALIFASCTVKEATKASKHDDFSLEEQVAYQRSFEAAVWAMPATAIHRLREGFLDLPGVDNNVVIAYSAPATSIHKAITANTATPYITAFSDLREGPVVLEVPAVSDKASLYGQVVDAWQSTIADVGPAGLDQGKGGKYIFLPPNYQGEVPEGYIPVECSSYRISLVFRSIRAQGATDQDAYDYTQELEMYYYNDGATPEPTKFVDGLEYPLDTLPHYDISIFEDIHSIISVEPVKDRDKVMMGMLETIGIKPDEEFNPSDRMIEIMEKAAKDANEYMHQLVEKHHEEGLIWQDRNWSFVMQTDYLGGFDFVTEDAVQIDKRAAAWNFFTLYPKKLSERPATVYLAPTADSDGNKLEAGNLYKINVPANMPASQFWSITIYDEATWAFIDNPLDKSGLGQFNKDNMVLNEDGSVDIYFGPEAPEGLESNWVPTEGKRPYVWLRLYGPTEEFWNKSFVMPDVELVD